MSKRSRVEFLKTCLRVRIFLRDHPDSTVEEVYANVPNASGCLMHLQSNGAATFTGGGKKGPARWRVCSMSGCAKEDSNKPEIVGGKQPDLVECPDCETLTPADHILCIYCRTPLCG